MRSRDFRVRVQGPIACFTRPEFKVERVSYEVMTPSAARGILESVLWKPAIVWRITKIAVLAPIKWLTFQRNEVKKVCPDRGNDAFYVSKKDIRTQRNTVALRDVDYVIEAHFEMTPEAGETDNVIKFEEMFKRRVEHGQCKSMPYLGCREFAASVSFESEYLETPKAINETRPLMLMFYDFLYPPTERNHEQKNTRARELPRPLFFQARLDHGVLSVPSFHEVLRYNAAGVSESV